MFRFDVSTFFTHIALRVFSRHREHAPHAHTPLSPPSFGRPLYFLLSDDRQGEGLRNGQQGARNPERMKKEKKVEAKASTDHEYLGCYRYNKDISSLLKNGKSFYDKTDQALCRAHCEEYDTAFYAMEHGDICWCPTSPDINDYIIDDVGNCDKPCTGDPSIFCGGVFSISMFEYQDVGSSTGTGEYEEYESSSGTVQEDDDDGFSSSTESVCTNGVSGIESDGVCCEIRMKVLWTLLLGAAPVAFAEDSTAAVWLGDHSIQGEGLVAETGSSLQRKVSKKNEGPSHHGARSSRKSRPCRKRNNDGVKAEFSLEYEHIGCFADNKTDRVLGHLMKSPLMTSAMCAEHCFGRRATYMALQYGYECWCSRYTELDYSRHSGTDKGDADLCDLSCYGCDAETCGGLYAFDLYKLDGPMPSDSREYVGCFADDQEDRALANKIKFQDNMTQDVCRVYCERFGSSFYATQYGDECWCGATDDVEEYKRHGDGECIAGCFGDPAIACGGYYAFSLFEYLDDDDDETATECADEGSDDDDHGEDAWYTPSPSTARTDSPESPTTSEMPGFMPIDGDLPLCQNSATLA
ncbi:conserved unknown protein [Ectocarpus siliculosus]|uniref:WSC domain-containing protein n=1 Tax=Ectocarpus siliculosus TaxID=2880 RepID=D7FXK6_ECTSI|nr:conserved unknown protein [Ectocarpus siliculosus]|eukprot:CBJ26447.1 conserved unknown protein [Ectocarpus siliculosus]